MKKHLLFLSIGSGILSGLAGVFCIYAGNTHAMLALGGFWLLLALFSFCRISHRKPEVYLSISFFSLAWLGMECFYYFLIPRPCIQDYSFIVNGYYTPDSLYGFKIRGENISYGRIVNNVCVYDSRAFPMQPNREGFKDQDAFTGEKDSTYKRILWLGDSFSAGLHIEENLPQSLENIALRKGHSLQIYNYSVDGGGIANWHKMYISHLTKQIPHDALILAVYADNLNRDFAVADTNATSILFTRLKSIPENLPEYVSRNHEGMKPILNRLSSAEAEQIIQKASENPICFGFNSGLQSQRWSVFLINRFLRKSHVQENPLAYKQLEAIVRTSHTANRPVILIAIPDLEIYQSQGSHNNHSRELEQYAGRLGCKYINGYQAWDALGKHHAPALYLQYDRHWNALGSRWFANWLYPFLDKCLY